MKASEVVEHLSSLDADLPVLINGYEGGYHELEPGFIRIAWTFPNRYLDDSEWWYGPHWEPEAEAEGAAESLVRSLWDGTIPEALSVPENRELLAGEAKCRATPFTRRRCGGSAPWRRRSRRGRLRSTRRRRLSKPRPARSPRHRGLPKRAQR